jgi:hypothetical protein
MFLKKKRALITFSDKKKRREITKDKEFSPSLLAISKFLPFTRSFQKEENVFVVSHAVIQIQKKIDT